jgi:hypothetical protein
MHAIHHVLWGLMFVAAVAGCRSKDAKTSPEPETDPNTPVVVEVENHYLGDVVIYLVRGTQRQRLGMVTAMSSAVFSFPWRRLGAGGTDRMLAYPIAGSRAHVSEPLYVQPGQSVKWTLESDLDRSNMAVY